MISLVVKALIQDHINNIDNDNYKDLFLSATNELSGSQMKELLEVFEQCGIDTEQARLSVLHYILTMSMDVLTRPKKINDFIHQLRIPYHLGFTVEEIHSYILENADEWDDSIQILMSDDNDYYIHPIF